MEIKAPDGYELPTTGTSITIDNADGTASISNTKGGTTPLPATGGLGTVILVTVGLVVITVYSFEVSSICHKLDFEPDTNSGDDELLLFSYLGDVSKYIFIVCK